MKDQLAQQMLRSIPDPKLRKTYGDILSGKMPKSVHCLSAKCKGRLVGYIQVDGKVIEEPTFDKKTKEKIAGVVTSRDRFDGKKGFHCACGNRSILAKEEQGIISSNPPTQNDIMKIASRLQKRGNKQTPVINGTEEVDGFRIQEIK